MLTKWLVKTSIKHEALSFFNTLCDDDYYIKYYKKEYAEWHIRLTPEVTAALDNTRKVIGCSKLGISRQAR